MAVLSAAGVRRDLLHAAGQAGALIRGGHRVAADLVDRALARLAERSLLTFSLDGQTIIAHRLVMRVVRDGLARRGRLTTVVPGRRLGARSTRARRWRGRRIARPSGTSPEQVTALLDNTAGPAGEADEELAESSAAAPVPRALSPDRAG